MTYEDWWASEYRGHTGQGYAKRAWEAAQAAERERIKSRVKDAAESLWCIMNQVGGEPYALYIGPSLDTLDQFVDQLLEKE